jgi:HPt (histidine-containing phosphotransfer) domain-containing protein
MYRNFLNSYVTDVSGCADQLKAHLTGEKYKDAARVMHTLKGLSATVGANDLSAFAAKLEAQLKKGAPEEDSATLVAQTRSSVEATLVDLREVMAKIDAKHLE